MNSHVLQLWSKARLIISFEWDDAAHGGKLIRGRPGTTHIQTFFLRASDGSNCRFYHETALPLSHLVYTCGEATATLRPKVCVKSKTPRGIAFDTLRFENEALQILMTLRDFTALRDKSMMAGLYSLEGNITML